MVQINIIRYQGSKHVSLVADQKNNSALCETFQATATTQEKAESQLRKKLQKAVEGEDFELVFQEPAKFTKLTTEKLLTFYDKTEKMLGAHEMIEEILVKRGALSIIEPAEEVQEPEEGTTSQEIEEETEEETPAREYKKCMSDDALQERLAQARTNYRKFCHFLCTKDKEPHFGIIRSARLDKRSGFIQYRIEIIAAASYDSPYELTGRIYGKGDDSKDLTIFEEKPEELKDFSLPTKKTAKEPAQEPTQESNQEETQENA